MKRTEILDYKTRRLVPIKWLIVGHENYGFATKSDIEELTNIINKLKQEMASEFEKFPREVLMKRPVSSALSENAMA